MNIKEHSLDKRVLERLRKDGRLDPKMYKEMLEKLPDLRDKVQKPEPNEAPES